MIVEFERQNIEVMAHEMLRRSKEERHSRWRQKKVRPRFEDVVCHLLDGVALKDALIFVEKIRAGGMKVKWTAFNTWKVTLNRKLVCEIKIENDTWSVNYVSGHVNTRNTYIPYSPSRMKCKFEALKDVVFGTQKAYQASF